MVVVSFIVTVVGFGGRLVVVKMRRMGCGPDEGGTLLYLGTAPEGSHFALGS